jgi:hypothetical protein
MLHAEREREQAEGMNYAGGQACDGIESCKRAFYLVRVRDRFNTVPLLLTNEKSFASISYTQQKTLHVTNLLDLS